MSISSITSAIFGRTVSKKDDRYVMRHKDDKGTISIKLVNKSVLEHPSRHVPKISVLQRSATANVELLEKVSAGQTVVEIGCGSGATCLEAGNRVTSSGRVIGIDSSPVQVEKARDMVVAANKSNIEFYLCRIDSIPLPDASADWVISHRQINLASNKLAVFREVSRALKPGGRFAVHDIALKKLLPAQGAEAMAEYLEGLSGAIEIRTYERFLRLAGFSHVSIIDSGTELRLGRPPSDRKSVPTCVQGHLYGGLITEMALRTNDGYNALRDYNLNDYAAMVHIMAIR